MATGWLAPYVRGGLWKELLGRWRGIVKPVGHGEKQ